MRWRANLPSECWPILTCPSPVPSAGKPDGSTTCHTEAKKHISLPVLNIAREDFSVETRKSQRQIPAGHVQAEHSSSALAPQTTRSMRPLRWPARFMRLGSQGAHARVDVLEFFGSPV